MPEDHDDDRTLLERWRGGDADAGEAFARRHYSEIQKFLARRLDPQAAADLAQDVFLAALEKDSFADIQSVKRYLFGIARFKRMGYLRARAPEELDSQIDPVSGASSLLAREEDRVLLLGALKTLSDEDQLYLLWYYADGLSQREIAERVGLAEPQVRGRMHRARDKLRAQLERLSRTPQQREQLTEGLETWLSTLRRNKKDPRNDDS
jgi:RNA polymerase sigma factor (sigma-70 family)